MLSMPKARRGMLYHTAIPRGPEEGHLAQWSGAQASDWSRLESWFCVTCCLYDHGQDAKPCPDL